MENKRIFKKIFIPVISSLLFSVSLTGFAGEEVVDFSGRWVVDQKRSDPGEGRREVSPSELEIEQEENRLIVERSAVSPEGRREVLTEEYTLDGETNVNTGMRGQEIRSTVRWSDDREALIFETTQRIEPRGRRDQVREMEATEIWSLSDDGDTLTVEITRQTQRGQMKRRIVYNREN